MKSHLMIVEERFGSREVANAMRANRTKYHMCGNALDVINMREDAEWVMSAITSFPLAEPATAQKQYARLQAAKAWLKERGK